MKKLLWGVIGLVVILAASVIIVPPLIDWNQYRAQIASRIKTATGRDLIIGGDIKLDLLPSPALEISDLRLSNMPGAVVPHMVSLKSLRVQLALGPLLGGNVSVQSIRLIEPVVELESLPDGRNNLSFEAQTAAPSPEKGEPKTEENKTGSASAPSVQVENFVIEKGTIIYRDHASRQLERMENINARFAAGSLKGPLESSGSAVVRGLPLSFTLTAGTLVEGRTMPFTLDMKIIPGDVTGHISGAMTGLGDEGGKPRAKGKVEIGGANLAHFLDAIGAGGAGGGLPGFLKRPFTATTEIALAGQKLSFGKLALGLPGLKGNGAASVAFGAKPEARLALKIGRLDLDKLLAKPVQKTGKGKKGRARPGNSAVSIDLARVPKTKPGGPAPAFALPPDFNASLNMSVEAAVWSGQLIRGLALDANLSNGEVTINQLSATLPGGSDVAVFGFLSASKGTPAFEGTLDLRTNNLRGALKWLKITPPLAPRGRLNRFSLVAKVKTNAKEISLDGIDLRLDGTRAKGAATIAFRERPSFGANLAIDRLNLDGYLALGSSKKTQAGRTKRPAKSSVKAGSQTAPPSKPADDPLAVLTVLGAFDANLRARIKSLTFGGMPISDLRFEGTAHNGRFQLRDLSAASVAGLAFRTSGQLVNLAPAATPRIENVKFQMKTGNFVRFLKAAGVNYRPRRRSPMVFSLSGAASGNGLGLQIANLRGRIGKLSLQGTGGLDFTGPRPRINADISTSSIILEDFLPPETRAGKGNTQKRSRTRQSGRSTGKSPAGRAPSGAPVWSNDPINLSGLAGVDADIKLQSKSVLFDKYRLRDARLEALLVGGKLDARRLSGRLFGGDLNVQVQLASRDPSPLYQAHLSLKGMDVPSALRALAKQKLKSGKMDLTADLTSSGTSQAALVGALKGQGNLSISRLDIDARSVGGTAFAPALVLMSSFNQLAGKLGGNRKKGLADLTGSFQMRRGIARSGDLKLVSTLGRGTAKGVVDLPKWWIDAEGDVRLAGNLLVRLLDRKAKSQRVLPFSLRGPLDNPKPILETGKMPGRGIVIPGLDRLRRKKGVGAVINQIFPGKPPDAQAAPAPAAKPAPGEPPPLSPPPASPEPRKKAKPKDILKNLILRGLGG